MENKNAEYATGAEKYFKSNGLKLAGLVFCASLGTLGLVKILKTHNSPITPIEIVPIQENYIKELEEAKEKYKQSMLDKYNRMIQVSENNHIIVVRDIMNEIEQAADSRANEKNSREDYKFEILLARGKYIQDGIDVWSDVDNLFFEMVEEAEANRMERRGALGIIRDLRSGDPIQEFEAQRRYGDIIKTSKDKHGDALNGGWNEIEQAADSRANGKTSQEEWRDLMQGFEEKYRKMFDYVLRDRTRAESERYGEGLQKLWSD